MQCPIVGYGHPILQQATRPLRPEEPGLAPLLAAMWDTLAGSGGCGLAAPQIGQALRVFIVDSTATYTQLSPELQQQYFTPTDIIRQVFINAEVLALAGPAWTAKEACLSIPGLQAPVNRPWQVTLRYQDADWQLHTRTFTGIAARMILHEYDHVEGILYLDHLPERRLALLQPMLAAIRRGEVDAAYPMRFANVN